MGTEPLTTSVFENNSILQNGRRRRMRVFAMLFISFLAMIVISASSLGYWAQRQLQSALQEAITRNLTQKAQMLANRVNVDHNHGIDVIASQEGQAAGARATIVDGNGNVVADSEISIASLGDEGRRPEFAAALHGSTGVETRSRNHAPVLYVAVPVSGGAVRLAYPLSDIDIATSQLWEMLLLGSICAAVAGLGISLLVSRIVSRH